MRRGDLTLEERNTLYIVLGQIDPSQWTGGEQVAGFNGQCEVGMGDQLYWVYY